MNDTEIHLGNAITAVLWSLAGIFLVAAWMSWIDGSPGLAMMLGFTACAALAVAAVAHIRCYASRVCGLIRVTHGLGDSERAELRPVR